MFPFFPGGPKRHTQVLLDFKAEINAVDSKRETPLSKASRTGMVDVVKFLLGAGAEIEVRDADNNIGNVFNSKVNRRSGKAGLYSLIALCSLLFERVRAVDIILC